MAPLSQIRSEIELKSFNSSQIHYRSNVQIIHLVTDFIISSLLNISNDGKPAHKSEYEG